MNRVLTDVTKNADVVHRHELQFLWTEQKKMKNFGAHINRNTFTPETSGATDTMNIILSIA